MNSEADRAEIIEALHARGLGRFKTRWDYSDWLKSGRAMVNLTTDSVRLHVYWSDVATPRGRYSVSVTIFERIGGCTKRYPNALAALDAGLRLAEKYMRAAHAQLVQVGEIFAEARACGQRARDGVPR